jgi:hypothetical protein
VEKTLLTPPTWGTLVVNDAGLVVKALAVARAVAAMKRNFMVTNCTRRRVRGGVLASG